MAFPQFRNLPLHRLSTEDFQQIYDYNRLVPPRCIPYTEYETYLSDLETVDYLRIPPHLQRKLLFDTVVQLPNGLQQRIQEVSLDLDYIRSYCRPGLQDQCLIAGYYDESGRYHDTSREKRGINRIRYPELFCDKQKRKGREGREDFVVPRVNVDYSGLVPWEQRTSMMPGPREDPVYQPGERPAAGVRSPTRRRPQSPPRPQQPPPPEEKQDEEEDQEGWRNFLSRYVGRRK